MRCALKQFENCRPLQRAGLGRSGFTLIELLVVVSIFIVLTSLTIGVIRLTADGDRVAASGRSLQASLEGTRMRSFKIREFEKDKSDNITAIGIRFLVDEDDWTSITSMVYIEQRKYITHAEILRHGSDHQNHVPPITSGTQRTQIKFYSGNHTIVDLWKEKLLVSGLAISIDGKDRTILPDNFESLINNHYQDNNGSIQNGYTSSDPDALPNGILEVFPGFDANTRSNIENIELTTRPTVMAQSEMILLAKGSSIDLLSSKLPASWDLPWRPNHTYKEGDRISPTKKVAAFGDEQRVFKVSSTGSSVSGNTEPDWSLAPDIGDTIVDNTVTWETRRIISNRPTFDLLFTPQGSIAGAEATAGVIHFVIALKRDVDLGLDVHDKYYNADRSGPLELNPLPSPLPDPLVPRGDLTIVSIFTQTGMITTSEWNPVDDDADPDYDADDPFKFSLSGSETNR